MRARRIAPLIALLVLAVPLSGVLAQDIDRSQIRPPSDPPPPTDDGGDATESDATGSAGAGAAVGEAPLRATPTLATFTDSAMLVPPGWLEVEAGYSIAFDALNLQAFELLGQWALTNTLELRLGWYVFGIAESGFEGDADTGVGDLYLQGKIRIPLPGVDHNVHRLAALLEVNPGFGQDPMTLDAFGVGGYAVYSVFPATSVRVDAQAGIRFWGGGNADSVALALPLPAATDAERFALPLSGVIRYNPLPYLQIFGEFLLEFDFTTSNNSIVRPLAGIAWWPRNDMTLDFGVALGTFSDNLMDGQLRFGFTWLPALLGQRDGRSDEPEPTDPGLRTR